MPKISVIMSVYNCESFVKESIISILNQSFSDFEFIIINDGSTDNTHRVICNIPDFRIRYINCAENKGVLQRSKEAIDLATSDYIAIQDGDDISMPNRLESQYKFLEENKDIFCVGSHAKKIGVDDSFLGDWVFPPENHKEIVEMLIIQLRCPIINPSSMFRLSGYKSVGGYSPDNSIKYTHDLDFWCRAIVSGLKFANIKEILLKYRVNPQGMSRKHKSAQLADHNQVISGLLKKVNKICQILTEEDGQKKS